MLRGKQMTKATIQPEYWQGNSPLQKLWGEWVQALSAMIAGIVWVDKCYFWLVDGNQGNH